MYSHLSNKSEVTLTDFEKKFHPPHTFPPSTFIDFLDFFHSSFIAVMCYFFPNNPTLHIYSNLHLLILHPLHIYSNLHGY